MTPELVSLNEEFPLAPGWKPPEAFSERVKIGGASIYLEGLAIEDLAGQQITASAAHVAQAPVDRCYFELLERTSIIRAMNAPPAAWAMQNERGEFAATWPRDRLFPTSPDPQLWAYSKSNGVALHTRKAEAHRRAKLELIERDRILRSWSGEIRPERGPLPESAPLTELAGIYAFENYFFRRLGSAVSVSLFLASPKTREAPFVYGFGAEHGDDKAALKAAEECLQRLGFLWGEEISPEEPEFSPTPDFHQEIYLRPAGAELVRRWLKGGHAPLAANPVDDWDESGILYADLTPNHLAGKIHVIKAVAEKASFLKFGKVPPAGRADFPEALWIHPLV